MEIIECVSGDLCNHVAYREPVYTEDRKIEGNQEYLPGGKRFSSKQIREFISGAVGLK